MAVRVRFAPSPTGHVHIGNIRAAIFNWLFARHEGGQFLLRVEDTDRERSTPAAIATLLDVMAWLGLDFDEEPVYQTRQAHHHAEAAQRLLDQGHAYRSRKGGEGEAILFRIPLEPERVPGVGAGAPAELNVHPEEAVTVSLEGVFYAGVSTKGKPVSGSASCLAGMGDLVILDAGGRTLFRLPEVMDRVRAGESFSVPGAACLRFTRRSIAYDDMVKGSLSKPLDSLRDFVIVRSDGNPVFHLANVCDDILQGITHIIRGDDHVENTYRHIFLFHALGAEPPRYGHLPMIVNAAGKPYSKRDGDAFVGDFRDKGYLPEALFNYLSLLGWNPGDGREKLGRQDLVAAFSLDRVQQSAAQMDLRKLLNLNGQYMAEMPFEQFLAGVARVVRAQPWGTAVDEDLLRAVARLMHSRTKVFADAADWGHFFAELPDYDDKAVRKFLQRPGIAAALETLAARLAATPMDDGAAVEAAVAAVAGETGHEAGSLNQPIRVAVTGCTVGAGVYETLGVLGAAASSRRLCHAAALARGEGLG